MNLPRIAAFALSLSMPTSALASEPPAPAAPAPVVEAAPETPVAAPIPFGFDLFPMVGTSTAAAERRRVASLNLGGGLSGGIDAFELAAGFNIATGEVRGAQIAGGVNVVLSDVKALQIAGGVNLATGALAGAQLAPVNLALGGVDGLQLGPVSLSGADVRGLQLGVVNVAAGEVDGVQLGVLNVATGDVDGLQLGVVNIARNASAGIGLLNVYTEGWTDGELVGTDAGMLLTGVRHGSGAFYNVYYVGAQLGDETKFAYGLGLGLRRQLSERVEIAMDLSSVKAGVGTERAESAFIGALRPHVTVKLLEGLAIYAGPTLNVQVTDHADVLVDPLLGAWDLTDADADVHVRMWPGFSAGLRIL